VYLFVCLFVCLCVYLFIYLFFGQLLIKWFRRLKNLNNQTILRHLGPFCSYDYTITICCLIFFQTSKRICFLCAFFSYNCDDQKWCFFEQINEWLRMLERHSDIVELISIGSSYEGRELVVIKVRRVRACSTSRAMYVLSKSHSGTTNGLRDGTQVGVPPREELVTVCVEMCGDAWRCEPDEVVHAMSWRK